MKILVVHASAGAGHKKAAEALVVTLQRSSQHEVLFADILDYTSPSYKNSYQKGYTFLITKMPWLWALFFNLTDSKTLAGVVRMIRRISNKQTAKPFEELLKREQYDYIFSTHFFPNEVASYLKRNGYIFSKVISVVTDFDVHRMWLADGVDHYTAACDHTKKKLLSLGVPESKILVAGIPTDPKFALTISKDEMRDKLQLRKDVFTVLLATGSFGMGPIKTIIERLPGFQVLVVCGSNKKLFEELDPLKKDLVHIFGLVNNMDELMSAADCMVTKPGGLSISEALIKGLPMIFFSAIPGQETKNITVLAQCGIGMKSKDISSIIDEIKRLSQNPDYFKQSKDNTQRLARTSAAISILRLMS